VQLKVGSITTVLHVAFLLLAMNTWAYVYFELGEFPTWALIDKDSANATLTNRTIPFLNV